MASSPLAQKRLQGADDLHTLVSKSAVKQGYHAIGETVCECAFQIAKHRSRCRLMRRPWDVVRDRNMHVVGRASETGAEQCCQRANDE